MESNNIYTTIISQIKTKEERDRLRLEINKLSQAVYGTVDTNLSEMLAKSVRERTAILLSKVFLEHNIHWQDPSEVSIFFKSLQDELLKLRVLKLTLAIEPSSATVGKLFTWVVQNLGSGIILDFAYDLGIAGGALIEYQGRYSDYSLKKKLDEYFKKSEELFG